MDSEERQEVLVRMFGAVNAYDEDEHLFIVSPDRIGFGVISPPLAGISPTMAGSIEALLDLPFPKDTLLQCALYASPDIEEVLHRFHAMRESQKDPVLKAISANRITFLRDLTERPIGEVAGARLRDSRVVITVQIPHGVKPPTDQELEKLREMRQHFCSAVKQVGFNFQALTADSYLRFMDSVLNHGSDAQWRKSPWTHHEKNRLLCNQILDLDTAIDIKEDRISLGDYAHVRVLSPKRYPDHVWYGMAGRYLGDTIRGSKAARDPLLITMNLIYGDQEKERAGVSTKAAMAQRNAEGRLARFVPEYAKQAESYKELQASIDRGRRVVQGYIGCAVLAKTPEGAIQSSMETIGMFRELGLQMMFDRYALQPMFAQLLPFAASTDIKQGLLRYRTATTEHFAPMLPVLGTWRGTSSPLLTLIGRDGQFMTFSPFNSDGNYNFTITAESGAGKSYLANNLTTNILAIGGRVWIIDRGFSYKKLCENLDGQYIEFDDNSNINLNFFSLVKNFDEEVDILCALIAVMAAPKQGLTDFQTNQLPRVLRAVWDLKHHDMVIDDLAEACLQEEDIRLKDLGHQLFPFTSKGQFGKFFNDKNSVNIDNRLVVLELQHLTGRPQLQRVVLLQIMYQIQQSMDSLPRSLPKLMLIDEAWSLLATNETKDFIIGWYRQLRKFGASAGVCTQSVNDYYQNSGAQAIVENSSSMLLLRQKGESIESASRSGQLTLSKGEFDVLKTVHTVPGEYSEIMVRTSFGTGVGRLVESPFNNLLYSTHPDDVTAIDQHRAKGMSQVQAINKVLEDRVTRRRA